MKTVFRLAGVFLSVVFLGGCGSDAANVDPSNVSAVISAVDAGIVKVGTSLSGAVSGRGVDDVCGTHAEVLSSAAVSGAAKYPALVHYCLIAKNTSSPDSVQGNYALIKSIMCGMTAAGGIKFDGVATEKVMPVTTDCFSQKFIDENGTSITATVTGSATPTFAPNYAYGVEISVPAFSMTYKFATKVAGTLVSYVSFESSQGEGAFAGAFDSSNGKLWYEARMDRLDAGGRDTGWSRHIRLYADVLESGSNLTLEDYSGIYSDVGLATSKDVSYRGRVATAQGNTADGLYVHENYTDGTVSRSELADPTNVKWLLANSTGACVAIGGAATCTGNTGMNVKSAAANGNFFLIPTNTTYTGAAAWMLASTGLTFTSATFAD